MKKIILTLLPFALVACGENEQPTGPDWSKYPPATQEPSDKPDDEKSMIPIEPTINTAPEGEDISRLQYTPGMQIDIAETQFSTRLKEIADAGFKYVELKIKYSHGLHNKSDAEINTYFADMQQQMVEKGIKVWSVHLPYEDKNWTSISAAESIRQQSVEYIMRIFRLCVANFPTCKNYVIHASKSVSPSSTAISQAHKSLAEMDVVAKQYGVRFCVENLVNSFCYTINDVLAVIGYSENVFATFDIGHANCKGYDVVDFLEALGTKLGTVHIHDTIFGSDNDSHQLVGDGNLASKNRDWGEVYKTMLEKNRYRGVFMFEPQNSHSAAEIMRRFNDIILASYNNLNNK